MVWIQVQGPDPVRADVLDRIMYLGVPSTLVSWRRTP